MKRSVSISLRFLVLLALLLQEAPADNTFAQGQAIKLISKMESLYQRGFWVAIQIDPKTGKRVAVSPQLSNGGAAGY
ncbi:MAG TPA: hypothetical protein VI260_00035 [Blastocatellia bacterium]|jgi:hypothetical protein